MAPYVRVSQHKIWYSVISYWKYSANTSQLGLHDTRLSNILPTSKLFFFHKCFYLRSQTVPMMFHTCIGYIWNPLIWRVYFITKVAVALTLPMTMSATWYTIKAQLLLWHLHLLERIVFWYLPEVPRITRNHLQHFSYLLLFFLWQDWSSVLLSLVFARTITW